MNRLLSCALALLPLPLALAAPPDNTPIVIVELFTSEGCSSCPPADEFLTSLSNQNIGGAQVIVLSEHVDYWDRLGWRDPFSSSLFTARQQAYGEQFRLDSVFTPQLVVDGWASVSGNERDAAQRTIRKAAQFPKATASVSAASPDRANRLVSLKVTGLAAPSTDRADVFFAVIENDLATQVPSGENAGRRLRHTGVVRTLTRVAEIEAKKGAYVADLKVKIDPTWRSESIRGVLIVQDHKTHKIVGAASCSL